MLETIDLYFPFIVIFYGAVMTFICHSPYLLQIGQDKIPVRLMERFESHKTLGLICLAVGGLWSLQRVLFYW